MITVVMQSDEYGREMFPRDTMNDAIETMQNLIQKASEDNVERIIGILVNERTGHD